MWRVGSALGKSFLVAALMPAMAFIAACDALVLRHVVPRRLFDLKLLGIEGAVYIVGGCFLGLVLVALNAAIIQAYERGFFISRWLERRHRERHLERYTALLERRQDLARAATREERQTAIAKLEAAHLATERKHGAGRELPHTPEQVAPTALGNVLAAMEEYPYERYGMDAAIYWPRLAAVIPESYKTLVADLKTTFDFWLNLSLLAGLGGLLALGVGGGSGEPVPVVAGIVALFASHGLYRLAVGAARSFGELVASCFDLFRRALLEQCGLPQPQSLADEQRSWQMLASFIRRGEAFYFPQEEASPPPS